MIKGRWHSMPSDLELIESAGGLERLLWTPLAWGIFLRWVAVWSAP